MRGFRLAAPVLAVALLCTTMWAQAQRRDEGNVIRGRVVRVSGPDNSFVVRVDGGKEVILYGGPRSVYRFRDRDVRFDAIREGMTVSAVYEKSGDRYIAGAVTLVDTAPPDRPAGEAGPAIRGRVMKAASDPNHLVIRTEDGKEMILYLDDRRDMSFTFTMREGKRILTSMTAGEAPRLEEGRKESQPTELHGTIVRVIGPENQFVVRTAEGKEVIFYADPRARYEFDGKVGAFTDLREGVAVDVGFELRDRKHYANRIVGRPRRR